MSYKEIVRKLRKNQTESEKIIWEIVRNRKLKGQKFLRQHPIIFPYEGRKRFFVADFYCAKRNLVVEIDGKVHDDQQERDKFREHLIEKIGMKVIRFKNEEVEHDLENVIRTLESYL